MPNIEIKLPETSEAEEWLDPETFIVDGHVYKLTPSFKVIELNGDNHDGE